MIFRSITKNKKFIKGFHCQEFRHSGVLTSPIKGLPSNAWLGIGYYFWLEEEFAHYWGVDKKKLKTGAYDVYTALIEESGLLNASFNERAYFLFRKVIDEAISHCQRHGKSLSLEQAHRFLADNIWPNLGVKGIIYDDLPHNNSERSRVYSYIAPLYYKKRLQVVVFDIRIIHKFAIFKEELC